MSDWPIKAYLKRHFSNQRSYNRRTERIRAARAINGKRYDNWSDGDFGSGEEAGDEAGEAGNNEGDDDNL